LGGIPMRPYSLDLRQRVAQAVDNHEGSLRQLARRFFVSLSFVARLLALRRQTQSLDPRPHRGGRRPAIDGADLDRLRQLVADQPDATLDELAQRLGKGSTAAVCRALRRLNITRKKKVLRADQRQRPDVLRKRKEFLQELATTDPEHRVYVDEFGATTAMARTHGRAAVGERVYDSVPGKWESMTVIAGMRLGGVMGTGAFAGATDTPTFRVYAEQVLAPELRPDDVVILDNLKPHKDKEVVAAIEAAGARVLPLPPWSPDLSPIEEMFSKVKGLLRDAAARTAEGLMAAVGQALEAVCPEDIRGWFGSRGGVTDPDERPGQEAKALLDRLRSPTLCAMQS
jgi:transposase